MDDEIRTVLQERGGNYGRFIDNASTSQGIKAILRHGPGYDLASESIREALDMISHKMARIVSGKPAYLDSWIDIIGYAQLVVDELKTPPTTEAKAQNEQD